MPLDPNKALLSRDVESGVLVLRSTNQSLPKGRSSGPSCISTSKWVREWVPSIHLSIPRTHTHETTLEVHMLRKAKLRRKNKKQPNAKTGRATLSSFPIGVDPSSIFPQAGLTWLATWWSLSPRAGCTSWWDGVWVPPKIPLYWPQSFRCDRAPRHPPWHHPSRVPVFHPCELLISSKRWSQAMWIIRGTF